MRLPFQKMMKGKIEPLDDWLSKVEVALQQPLAAEEESPPSPPPKQPPPPPVAVPSMPKKRSNRHGCKVFCKRRKISLAYYRQAECMSRISSATQCQAYKVTHPLFRRT